MIRRPLGVLCAACLLTTLTLAFWVLSGPRATFGRTDRPRSGLRMPGDFERQQALIFGWDDQPDTGYQPLTGNQRLARLAALTQAAAAVHPTMQVVVLVRDAYGEVEARRALEAAGVPGAAVRFETVDFETFWLRDSGPAQVQDGGRHVLLDADFLKVNRLGRHAQDDLLPSRLASLLRLPVVRAPIALNHGNLLANGEGLLVTTYNLLERNSARGYDASRVKQVLREYYGGREILFLNALVGESTGHVDMFATFARPNLVLVGSYSPQEDAVNARILDDNARRLAAVHTRRGPLQVVRVPMPPRFAGLWPTYMNVVYANGTLLVPSYPGLDPVRESAAHGAFQRALPDWRLVKIDCTPLIVHGGALRCATVNLRAVGVAAGSRQPREDGGDTPQGEPGT